MPQKEPRINNKYLDEIMLILLNISDNKKPIHGSKTERIKIYQNNGKIILQIKHTITRQVVRFCINETIDEHQVVMNIQLRNRNPNTIEYFHNAFTLQETLIFYEFDDFNKLNDLIKKVCDFLNTDSEFIKVPFKLIKTCQDPSDLTDSNVLIKTITEAIEYTNSNKCKCIELTFKDYPEQFIMVLDETKEIRLPYQDDLFFISKDGRYQTYGQYKAGFHFSF